MIKTYINERTELLKKAVLAGVGASQSVDKIKSALTEAMNDLVKVGQNLLDELEVAGKEKTESMQGFLKGLQEEATKKTGEVSSNVQCSIKKTVSDFGLATRGEVNEILERISSLEDAVHGNGHDSEDGEGRKKHRKR
jgi:polyhydroxyalkanoate synthesis regulator phasin